jgi:NADH-quinone oxidoreductase subunit L
LAAGSVIIGMHHEQDMRKMGGLAKYMPWTAATSWIGSLALIGTPFLSGFYSKDTIIEAVGESHRFGAGYAYCCVLGGVFVTALYTFRMIFMTFHGPERFRHAHGYGDEHGAVAHSGEAHGDGHAAATQVAHETPGEDAHGHADPHESPLVVTLPLIALAIPSVVIGFLTIAPVLFGGYFGGAIQVLQQNNVVGEIGREFSGPVAFALHGFAAAPFWLAAAGVLCAWLFFLKKPSLADGCARSLSAVRRVLEQKYYFDWFNQTVIAGLTRLIGAGLWKGGDQVLIDGALVNGSASTVGWLGGVIRRVQNGYLYAYAFWMMIGLAVLLGWFLMHG